MSKDEILEELDKYSQLRRDREFFRVDAAAYYQDFIDSGVPMEVVDRVFRLALRGLKNDHN